MCGIADVVRATVDENENVVEKCAAVLTVSDRIKEYLWVTRWKLDYYFGCRGYMEVHVRPER